MWGKKKPQGLLHAIIATLSNSLRKYNFGNKVFMSNNKHKQITSRGLKWTR